MAQTSQALWAQSVQQFQEALAHNWAKSLQSLQANHLGDLTANASDLKAAPVQFDQDKIQVLQQQYLQDAAALWAASLSGTAQPKDKRFASQAWSDNPLAAFSASAYLLNARTLMGLADAVEADTKARARIRFAEL